LADEAILEIANQENRILLTNDKDFGEIVFRQKLITSGVILFRIKGQDVPR
jgi:predicted nuclease of predicted toxin-antitoxin system